MYPADFFALFPPFPRENKVFVAISFARQFDKRWQEVIAPAIRTVGANGTPLEPTRVDTRKISESIQTEIITGIGNSRLILANITTIGHVDGCPVRNGNVMYEVGIAHAIRLPEEVILFRSDDDPLLFDTSNIRVNLYNPDEEPEAARRQVTATIVDARKELHLRRHMAVRRAAESLDYPCFSVMDKLLEVKGGIKHPKMGTMRQVAVNTQYATAITRLLELGIIKTSYVRVTPELLQEDQPDEEFLKYKITEFGQSVYNEITDQMGIGSPEIEALLEKSFQDSPPEDKEKSAKD